MEYVCVCTVSPGDRRQPQIFWSNRQLWAFWTRCWVWTVASVRALYISNHWAVPPQAGLKGTVFLQQVLPTCATKTRWILLFNERFSVTVKVLHCWLYARKKKKTKTKQCLSVRPCETSLCSPDCPRTLYKSAWPWTHRDPSASSAQALAPRVCQAQDGSF